ncbi:FtsW/RodA/SpoVE family cell cycle protein [Pseudonocardia adelaidensis]|uniref:beta-lactamase n=1 Tax=Pseudonocardia adelaidensis TaxID=648754 RepID=A0ABP9NNA6_9PSEU
MLIVEHGDHPVPEEPERRRMRRRDTRGVAFDVVAVLAALVLVGLGLANLYAVDGVEMAVRQATIAGVGVALLAALWQFRMRVLMVLCWITYVAAVVLLATVHVVGVTYNGATRWIAIGAFTFQPSELAKLGLLLALAAALGSSRPPWQRFASAVALAAVPIVLTVLQPDLSTTLLLLALTIVMLIIGRVPARFLVPLFGTAAIAAPLAVDLLHPYQLQRLGSFLVGAEESPTSAGWAVLQSHIAMGWGSLLGSADHPLTDLLSQYLPEKETDLALASLVEQYGLVAAAIAVVAAIVLIWRLVMASRAPRPAGGALVAAGLAVLFGIEVIVSVGGNLGLLPLAGVPFPLVSYGGTALVVHLAALGVALGVRRDGARRRLWIMSRWRNRRPRLVRAIALGLTALLVVFGQYAWTMLADRGAELAAAGEAQMTRCIRIPAERGAITDRHGAPLAVSSTASDAPTHEVRAVPNIVLSRPDDLTRLAQLVGRPAEDVRAALAGVPPTTLSAPVAEVNGSVSDAVTAAGLTGVLVVPALRRGYPTGTLLGPVLGFVGIATPTETDRWPDLPSGEIVGRAGLERQYDALLRGVNGRQCVYVSPTGVPVAMAERVEPTPGADLRTSLDLGLQRRLTASLANSLRGQARTAVAAAVAMDPRNGQVLAMASLPSYDNSVYGPPVDAGALQSLAGAPGHPMLEKVTQAAMPPGSTFKLVVATAGVLNPVFPPERAIPTGASFTVGGHTFDNWKPMGPMNLRQAITWSNDVYFYKLAQALGPGPVIDAARALGVGAPTGIDLPAESPGYLGTPDSVDAAGGHWYGGSTVILGIGQGYLQTTPLQNARWTAGVATGQMVTPRLGLATGTDQSVYTALPAPAPAPLPFADKLGPIRDGMRGAVTGGTAAALSGLPFPVAGKTGTAQDGSLPGSSYDNWLSAVTPAPDPSLVVSAVVQGPGTGGNNVKGVVSDAMQYYMGRQADVLATGPVQQPAG